MESEIVMDLCIDEKDKERQSEAQSDVRAKKRAEGTWDGWMDDLHRRHLPFGESCRHSPVNGNQNSKRKQRGEAKSSE